MRDGTIAAPTAVINSPHPICAACLYGKAKRRPHNHHTGSITHNCHRPGDGVSADQLEAGTPGIVATTKGLPTNMTYKFCNFWIDHYSKFIFVTMHPSKEGKEMINSKQAFEAYCRQHGVNVRSIRADNGIYSSAAFRDSCSQASQQLTYCGVGSHWQNGLAERAIGSIQATARTILLHAMSKWPTIITAAFRPFAIAHSVHLYNISSRQGLHKSPWELFTGTPPSKHPSDSRIFGCPAFVLNKSSQDNPSAAKKWTSRCWQGVYVGFSPMHASTVALIYNPSTKHVTPQFHVTYDEDFSTVTLSDPIALETWLAQLFNSTSTWKFVDCHGDEAPYLFDNDETNPASKTTACLAGHLDAPGSTRRAIYRPVPCSAAFRHWKATNNIAADVYHCRPISHEIPSVALTCTPHPPADDSTTGWLPREFEPSSTTTTTPSTTPHDEEPLPAPNSTQQPTATPTIDPDLFAGIITLSEGARNLLTPQVFQATLSDNDTLNQSEMLQATDAAQFLAAQIPEITGQQEKGVFTYHRMSKLPPRARLLNAIWSYKRKRSPTGALLKHKSRLCTDRSQQCAGIDYTDTYAPVVSWGTVRLVLALAAMLNLHSRQLDFTQAFTQSPIDTDVFM